jgi:hypothetical protein
MAEAVEERLHRFREELGAAQAALAGAVETGERDRLDALVRDIERKLERLILAVEIERQSDA